MSQWNQVGPDPLGIYGGQGNDDEEDQEEGFDDFDLDTDEEDEEEEESEHSSAADQDDLYPPEFPLSPATYEPHEIAEDEAEDEVRWIDREAENDRLRQLVSLYPFHFLDPRGAQRPANPQDAPMPIGQFRREMYQRMAQTGDGGEMQYVEFVPPWTDPDWSSRFMFTGQPGQNPVNDPQYKMYAKEGFLQSQRPALRDEDGLRDLTPAAKRYGVDPTKMDDAMYGNSGVTPTQGTFSVQLGNPRVTPSNQGVKNVVDKDDYDVLYDLFRNNVAGRGGLATDDDFKAELRNVAAGNMNPVLGEACDAQIAGALLQFSDGLDKLVLRDEYQRIIFGGSSSNEVCICSARSATQSW